MTRAVHGLYRSISFSTVMLILQMTGRPTATQITTNYFYRNRTNRRVIDDAFAFASVSTLRSNNLKA